MFHRIFFLTRIAHVPRVGTTMARVVHLKNGLVPYLIASGRCKVHVISIVWIIYISMENQCVWYKKNANFTKSPPNGIGLIINTLLSVNMVKYFESNISEKTPKLVKTVK